MFRKLKARIQRKRILSGIPSYQQTVSYNEMFLCANLFETKFRRPIKSFLEVGANFFQDAFVVQQLNGIEDESIVVIEPNLEIFNIAKRWRPNYQAFNVGASNVETQLEMQVAGTKSRNSGVSSLFTRNLDEEWITGTQTVTVLPVKKILDDLDRDVTDFAKIDVEGHTFEVLQGFGDWLPKFGMIQAESELSHKYWQEQRYFFSDIHELMTDMGFDLFHHHVNRDCIQCDTIWVNRQFA